MALTFYLYHRSESDMACKTRGGLLIYHAKAKKYTNDGQMIKTIEESIVVRVDHGYYLQQRVKKYDKTTKIQVKINSDSGQYELTKKCTVNKNSMSSILVTHHTKAGIIAYLKGDLALAFMLDYVEKTETLD